MGHRGGFNFGPASIQAKPVPEAKPVDPRTFRGYSYLLGDPPEACRTTIGANPKEAREILTALYSLLPLGRLEDNKRIPSGYTYLLQFVAHDLVETSVPFWAAAEAGVPSRNMRDETLGLDTLYGGGPVACPIAFQPAGYMVDYRTQLRLGSVADAASIGITVPACPYRDLARLKLDDPGAPSNVSDASQVYVADERSDDNTLVAQIVVLFSILHNAIAARLEHLGPQASFAHATSAMLLMYHAIIRHDLMPRLLMDAVYEALKDRPANSADWLWDGNGIPLEFTHGAFRVGHAMVRPFYQFNAANRFDIGQVLGGPVAGAPVRDPLPSAWIVEWQRFFKLTDVEPNYALKLAIHQQRPLDFLGEFQAVAPHSPKRLTMRDWLSAAGARTWRLDELISAATKRYPKLEPMDMAAIETWLNKLVDTSCGCEKAKKRVRDSIPLLRKDLPLPLYILLEADRAPINGAHLGPLGSVIVGETIFRCLTTAEAELAPLLPAAEHELGKDWDKIKAVKSMPDLVRLTEDWGKLTDCPEIPFIAP
jgi:Animal haem peroxidase